MEVLLIYPEIDSNNLFGMTSYIMAPLGLAFLASFVKRGGHKSVIIDNTLEKLSLQRLAQISKRFPLVGISCFPASIDHSLMIAKYLKENTTCEIIVGGPQATIFPDLFKKDYVDYICIGEGEETFLDLCNFIDNPSIRSELKDIPGLMINSRKGWIKTRARRLIQNLSKLPHPARELLAINKYPNRTVEVPAYPTLSISASRGCPHSCTFCSVKQVWGRNYRSFNYEWVTDDIEICVNNYKAKGIYFYEDNFLSNSMRVYAICKEIIKRKLDILWACEGTFNVDINLLKLMKKAGCQTIKLGLESGSERILRKLRKPLTLNGAKLMRRKCKEAEIDFACFIMMGIPTETDKEREITVKFVKELNPEHIIFNHYIPTPYSPLYKEILDNNLYSRIDNNKFLVIKEFENTNWKEWENRVRGRVV